MVYLEIQDFERYVLVVHGRDVSRWTSQGYALATGLERRARLFRALRRVRFEQLERIWRALFEQRLPDRSDRHKVEEGLHIEVSRRAPRLQVLYRDVKRGFVGEPIVPTAPAGPPRLATEHWVVVEAVDADEKPVAGLRLELVIAGGEVHGAVTGQDGRARVDRIHAANVVIRVLGIDGSMWRPDSGAPARESSRERTNVHAVAKGENLSRIARRYGLARWKQVWDAPENEALRTKRKSPHVIHAGDQVRVPGAQLFEIYREVDATHRIVVERLRARRGYVLQPYDLRFHANSAVLLAQSATAADAEVASDAPSLDVLASALLHAEERPACSLLLAGHSDAAEAPDDDRSLSEARAACVRHLLRGDREAWVALVGGRSCPEDLPAFLRWCAEARGWACEPEDEAGADTTRALQAFQEAYNQCHDASIAEDGVLGPQTWGAIFDVHQHQLAERLETDGAGLQARQNALQFCAAAESYGCGSALAVQEGAGADVASFRRADVKFFEPGEEPAASDLLLGPLGEPDFVVTPIPLRIAPRESVRLAVRELVYPGTGADSVPLEGKWLYAIADGALAFSVEAISAAEWRVTRAASPGPELARDGRIPLDTAQSYRLFLSPVPLSDAALQRLLAKLDECVWLTSVDRPGELHGAEAALLVRDVFQWALDLHHRHYGPKLDAWQSWVHDEERASRHFIASALKCVIDQGDEPGIRRHLQPDQPTKFLKQHLEDEKATRSAAERAAFQLASFVDCEDHRIIEQAHTDAGAEGVELAVVHWASVLGDLAQTFEGRQLLDVVATDAERVPRRFVFAEPPPVELAFADKRYLGLAGRALLKDLGPALLARLYPKETPKAREAVARFLERFGEARPVVGVYRQVQTNIARGRKLTHKVENKRALQKLIRSASKAADAAHQAQLPKGLVASQRLADAYTRNLEALDAGALLVIEVVNLGLALQGAFDKRSDTPRFETFASVIGASADLGVAMIEAYELLLQATKGTAKGALGMISGICDSVTFVQAVRRASSRYDYDQAFGHGIAAGGAGFVVAGSFCALWASVSAGSAAAAGAAAAGGATAAGGTAIAGGSLLSLGLLLGTGGAIAIGAGMAIATLATDNAYQQFAQLCFLGDEYDPKKSVRFPWSPVVLPARSEGASSATQNEMAAFITLLSSFEVEFTGTSLMIEPRFYRAGDVFEIYVEVHPINYAKNACVLEVDLESEQVTQLRGLRPLRDESKVFKDAGGRVTRIEIDLREAAPPSSPEVVVYHGGLARVRLRFTHGKTTWFVPPIPREGKPAQPWVQVSATYGDLGAVLASVRRGSSCDADLHVDGLKQPVQRGMKALHD